MCGEQSSFLYADRGLGGSPPRVRGTGWRKIFEGCRKGITPACAGNRALDWFSSGLCEDHPRVCGEQFYEHYLLRSFLGSPPRVRGTDIRNFCRGNGRRITPACAGNRPPLRHSPYTARDHPRVCGEQSKANFSPLRKGGSPPRVRGTGPLLQEQPPARGITPACAGNRLLWRWGRVLE